MNEPSTETQSGSTMQAHPLPVAWVERIFERLHGRFGAPFLGKWASGQVGADGLDRGVENAKRVWASELTGYTTDELKRGLSASYGFPPSLDEFRAACRPQADTRADWAEAREQMRIRLEGNGADRWSRPQVYWAAVAIGAYDLNAVAWDQIKIRWEKAIAQAKTDPIPEYRAQLPAPGKQTITREEAASRMSEIRAKLGAGVPLPGTTEAGTKWAVRLMEREASGEGLPAISRSSWREVLGYAPDADAKAVREALRKQPAAA